MPPNTHQALKDWLQAYHRSVGSAADECLQIFDRLRPGKLSEGNNLSLLRELLAIMSDLSPDPSTVSCAILFVAIECGEDPESARTDVSTQVSDQLDQLLYLIKMETEFLPAS